MSSVNLLVIALVAASVSNAGPLATRKVSEWKGPRNGRTIEEVAAIFEPKEIFQSLGGFSPWYDHDGLYGIHDDEFPSDLCHVDQVQIFMRHTSRLASVGANTGITNLAAKLSAAKFTAYDKKFKYLETWKWTAPSEWLSPYGVQEAIAAGAAFGRRYAHLMPANNYYNIIANKTGPVIPIRTTDQQRCTLTAQMFAEGLFGRAWVNSTTFSITQDSVIGVNSTIANNMCPAAATVANTRGDIWNAKFTKGVHARIAAKLSNSTVIALEDITTLMNACPFDTFVRGSASPICSMFTREEWKGYAHNQDLGQWSNAGYGSPIGGSWGAGWVNEMIARLTHTPVKDNTTSNRTLSADPKTFPLDGNIFLDFTHDSQLESAITAMGLFNRTRLSKDGPAKEGSEWTASNIAPMGGRLFSERVQCTGKLNGTYIRLLINNAVIPLDQLPACKAGTTENAAREAGLCQIDAFVKSQAYAQAGADFANCSKNYTGVIFD